MPASDIAALALTAMLAVVGPVLSPLEGRFFRSDPGTRRKLCAYGLAMALAWGLSATAVWIYGRSALLAAPAAATAWLPAPVVVGPVIGLLLTAYFAIGLLPLVQSLRGPRLHKAYAAAIRRHAEGFPGLLPANGVERLAFVFVSLTAGVCEEVLFRGFLIRFLHEGPAAAPVVAALLVTSVVFGLNHLYQGRKGVLGTSIAGLGFGLVFLLTGSLVPSIILHAAVDLQVVWLLRPAPGACAGVDPTRADLTGNEPLGSKEPGFPLARE